MLYYLLTALTFYVVAFVLPIPALGPVPSPVVKSLVFAMVHVCMHKMMKKRK